jgi:PAS domain S-box-containing protein
MTTGQINILGHYVIQSDLEKFFHLSIDLFCIAGLDGYFKKINPAFIRLLRWNEQELLDKPFIDFVHPDDVDRTRDEIEKLRSGVSTIFFENRYQSADGAYKWLRWAASSDVASGLIYAVAHDITEQRQAKAMFRFAIESAPSGMIMIDQQHSIVLANHEAEQIFGYQSHELLGRFVHALIPKLIRPGQNEKGHIYPPAVKGQSKISGSEVQGLRRDGSVFPVEVRLNPISTTEGEFILASVADISKRKKIEQERKELIFSLNQKVAQMHSLIETSMELHKLEDRQALLSLALERLTVLTNASKGFVQIKNKKCVEFESYFPYPFVWKKKQNGVDAISSKFTHQNLQYQFTLIDKESHSENYRFDKTDQLVLQLFSQQVKTAMETRHLLTEKMEKLRMDKEIHLASRIQQALLPQSLPEIPGYLMVGFNIQSRNIGGDFYECIPMPDGRYALVIGDVSGKGFAAALLVSSLHAALHACLAGAMTPVAVINQLNKIICETTTPGMYITFFLAVFEPETGKLESVNAGHLPPQLLKSDGSIIELKQGGIPLGWLDYYEQYGSEVHLLRPGDGLFMFTDGVTEAMNGRKQFYGRSRSFKSFRNGILHKDLDYIQSNLLDDIKKFTGTSNLEDDITVLAVKRANVDAIENL